MKKTKRLPKIPQISRRKSFLIFISLFALIGIAFIVSSFAATSTISVFDNSSVPKIIEDPETQAVELGVKFKSSVAGSITGINFYKGANNKGTHTGNLWSSDGALLATATFRNESRQGWQSVNFDKPVSIQPNEIYVASYHAPNGRYSADPGGLKREIKKGPLTIIADDANNSNGVYSYGSSSSFPKNTWKSANYWVDVKFVESKKPKDTVKPTIDIKSPIDGTSVNGSIIVSGTAGDNIGVTKVEVSLNNDSAQVAKGTSSWSHTLDVSKINEGSHTIKVIAYDEAGNVGERVVSINKGSITLPGTSNYGPAVDKQVVVKQNRASNSIVSPAISTTEKNQLILAFIATDGPDRSSSQTIRSVSGGGLSWTLKQRANSQAGTSEIWQAISSNPTNDIVVTAQLGTGSYMGQMLVTSFKNASTGAVSSANGTKGAPTLSLTTSKDNSGVWAVGNDWDNAVTRSMPAGQTKVEEFLASVGDTFWVQRLSEAVAKKGTSATINSTQPTNDRWNMAAIEIVTGANMPSNPEPEQPTKDTVAPSAPSNLIASVVGPNQIDLRWNASTDNVGVVKYQVFRGLTLLDEVAGVTSYSSKGLVANTSYSYTVKAVDAAGNISPVSSTATATTSLASDTSAPSAPGSVTAIADSSSKVTIRWSASSDNVGVARYIVYRGSIAISSNVTGLEFSDTTVVANTNYSYTIRAQDLAGNVSGASSVVTVRTPNPIDISKPSTPNGFNVSVAGTTQVNATWVASTDNVGVAGYNIYRNNVRIGSVNGLSYGDGSVSPNSSYTYEVTAFDGSGNESDKSVSVTVTTPTAPSGGGGIPSGVTLQDIDGGAGYFGKWKYSFPTDPGFYPIAIFNSFDLGERPSDLGGNKVRAAHHKELGINSYVNLYNGTFSGDNPPSIDVAKSYGMHTIVGPEPSRMNHAPTDSTYGNTIAAYVYQDEAEGNDCGKIDVSWLLPYCSTAGIRSDKISTASFVSMSNEIRKRDPNRPVYQGYTHTGAVNTGYLNGTIQELARSSDIFGYDVYPKTDNRGISIFEGNGRVWGNYSTVSIARKNTSYAQPVWPVIETSKVDTESGMNPSGYKITPADIKAGVWQSIIGGARGINYFKDCFCGSESTNDLLVSNTYKSEQEAIKNVNNEVKTLAPVINSPFANGFVTNTGQANTMTKYYAADGSFYIFAGSKSTSPQDITFTVKSGSTVTEVIEKRSISLSGNKFTDNFNGETAYHVYKVTVGNPDVTKPSVPSGLSASAVSSSQVNLKWSGASDNVGIANYIVYRNGLKIATVNGTSYNDTTISPNSSYSYTISSVDTSGNESSQSSPVIANVPDTPTTGGGGGASQPPIAAASGKTWKPIFNEDFDGSNLDLNKWSPCFSWAGSYEGCSYSFNNGRETYKPSQVRISNGIASLVAEPQARDGNGKTYKSGLITTSNKPGSNASLFKYKYGYAEARMKLPSQRGFFSAWWLMPPDYGSWNYAYEVDVLEALGGGDRIAHQTIHHTNRSQSWTVNSNGGNGKCSTFDYSQDFHTYGFDWQPTYIAMYIDGKECGRFSGPVWSGEMELILNLMIDVDWQRNVGLGMTNATLSGQMDIDYVKVWQQQ